MLVLLYPLVHDGKSMELFGGGKCNWFHVLALLGGHSVDGKVEISLACIVATDSLPLSRR